MLYHALSGLMYREHDLTSSASARRWAFGLFLGLLSLGVVACGPQPSEILDGEYAVALTSSPAITSEVSAKWKDAKIQVNRASKKLTLTFASGGAKPMELNFATTERSAWPVDCPGNYSSSQIEFFAIQTGGGDIDINGISYKEPVLFGQCIIFGASASNPKHVYLAEKSAAMAGRGGMGFACEAASKCVDFRTEAGN